MTPEQSIKVNDILSNGEAKTNQMLSELNNADLLRKINEFGDKKNNPDLYKTTRNVLETIGEVVFKAFNVINDNKDFIFYFWPGYTTLRIKDRIAIKGNNIRNWKDKLYFDNGVGYQIKDKEVIKFKDCPATLYFDAVLYKIEKYHGIDLPNDKKFYPPTTHYWKIQQDNRIEFKLQDETNIGILHIGLEIETKSEHCTLSIGINDIEKSVETISNQINLGANWSKKTNSNKKEFNYIEWPYNKMYGNELSDELKIQQNIAYTFWLSAVFKGHLDGLENLKNKIKVLSKPLYDRLTKYEDFEMELLGKKPNIIKNENYCSDVSFKHWYTLIYDDFDKENELGSAMFLTDKKLDLECLILIRKWVQLIYSQIRILDYSIQEDEIRLTATSDLIHDTSQFPKYLDTIIGDLKDEEIIKQLEPISFGINEWVESLKVNGDIINQRYKLLIKKIDIIQRVEKLISIFNVSIKQPNGGFLFVSDKFSNKLKKMDINLKKGIETYYIENDEYILTFLFSNLLSNAIKASLIALNPKVNVQILIESKHVLNLRIENNGRVLSNKFIEYIKHGKNESLLKKGSYGLKSIRRNALLLGKYCKIDFFVNKDLPSTIASLDFPI